MDAFEVVRDGLTLRGYIFGKGETPKPAVILSHGFMDRQQMCFTYAELLASLGYVCFTFDFAGGGPAVISDGATEDMTVLTECEDLSAVLDHVKAQPFVVADDVSLLGCSQGGFVSALVAARRPADVARLILLYPAFCIPDHASSGNMQMFSFDPHDIPDILAEEPMRLGGEYARCMLDFDVKKHISGYDGPVLYLHGDEDEIVSVDYARRLHTVYPRCEYVEIPGGKHVFTGEAELEAERLIAAFMRRD